MTRFAAALSEHPLATHAAGEVVGEVLERLGTEPDLAVLFVTAPFAGALEDIAATVRSVLSPRTLLGATAVSVVGGDREVEERAAVSLWAGRLPSPARPVRLQVVRGSGGNAWGDAPAGEPGWQILGFPGDDGSRAASLLLIADPFSFPGEHVLGGLRQVHPHLAVIGGLASAARAPGGNRLVLDGAVYRDGAIGVLLDADAGLRPVVSQGCRPIGEPYTVTRAEGQVLFEMGGKPALERLLTILEGLDDEDRALASRGLHCGIVADERKLDYTRGDFLIRGVLGVDRAKGAVAVGEIVEVGATVQFQVRDAVTADEDLRSLLAGHDGHGALVFTCNGRGTHLFGEPHHDAATVASLLDTTAVGGMFCAGELGPIAGRNALHGFTASVAVFD